MKLHSEVLYQEWQESINTFQVESDKTKKKYGYIEIGPATNMKSVTDAAMKEINAEIAYRVSIGEYLPLSGEKHMYRVWQLLMLRCGHENDEIIGQRKFMGAKH